MRRFTIMAIALAVAACAAGCGGGDVDRAASSTAAEASTTLPAASSAAADVASTEAASATTSAAAATAEVAETAAGAYAPVELTGCDGFVSTVTAAPKQVLVGGDSEYVLFDRLGIADRITAMAIPLQSPALPQEMLDRMRDLPSVYSKDDPYGAPIAENLVAIDPDFVFVGFQSFFANFDKQVLPTQEEYAAKGVATFLPKSGGCEEAGHNPKIETLYEDILDLGKVFGVEARAEEVVGELRAQWDAVTAKTASVADRPKVYAMGWYGESSKKDPPYFQNAEYLPDQMIELAGGSNVFHDDAEAGPTSWEAIAAKAPDVIVMYDFGKDPEGEKAHFDAGRDWLLSYPAAASIPAVKNRRIVYLKADGLFGLGLDTPETLAALAEGIHPELFGAGG